MCGISGFVDRRTNRVNEPKEVLRSMTDTLRHRGPDGAGYEVFESGGSLIGLGHRRLSIIDITKAGAQPMHKHGYTVTYNGEIYNFPELRSRLAQVGYQFHSQTDTEVLLSAYDYWGTDCLHQFQGMFAFALYDNQKQQVFIARDRLGVKPLFIYEKEGLILFASELKAFHEHPHFHKEIDQNALGLYLRYGYVPSPICIFRYCRKLAPGTFETIDLAAPKTKKSTYWSATDILMQADPYHGSESDLLDQLEIMLQQACNYRMVSDVPVGVFLSGGYDSSLVAALLQKDSTQKIDTFTIGFEDAAYDESPHARAVAKAIGTRHHEFRCTEKEAAEVIPNLPFYYDEPFADSSAIPTSLLSKRTSAHVKVALSADGGDELFGGYRRTRRCQSIHHRLYKWPSSIRHAGVYTANCAARFWPISRANKSVWYEKLGSMLNDPSMVNILRGYPTRFSEVTIEYLIGKAPNEDPNIAMANRLRPEADQLNALLAYDYQNSLTNDMLVKVDRATMAFGLEGREPLLDHNLYEFLTRLASKWKLKNGQLKYLLKQVAHKHLDSKLLEKPKKGFGLPIERWLRTHLRYLVDEHLSPKAIEQTGLLAVRPSQRIIKYCLAQQSDRGMNYLWALLMLQMWAKRW